MGCRIGSKYIQRCSGTASKEHAATADSRHPDQSPLAALRAPRVLDRILPADDDAHRPTTLAQVCSRENGYSHVEPSLAPDESPCNAGSSSSEIRRRLASEVDNGIAAQCVRMMM